MLLRKTLCAYEIPVLWNFTAEAAYKKQSCQVPLDTGIFAWNFKNLKPKQTLNHPHISRSTQQLTLKLITSKR